jgi:hypothetical protein
MWFAPVQFRIRRDATMDFLLPGDCCGLDDIVARGTNDELIRCRYGWLPSPASVRPVYLLMVLLAGFLSLPAVAATPVLTVTAGGVTNEFTAAELLARPDVDSVSVSGDPAYQQAMSYRGAPLRALLSALPSDMADTIQARAADGFVAEIPRAVIDGAAVPWIAIEDSAHPWPLMPGKTTSASPVYLVWQYPERAGISPEQWVYALAALTAA